MRPQRLGSVMAAAARGARQRLAGAGGSVVQAPVAAGLAWYIAHNLLGHPQPFFAPTAAAVSISKQRALRSERAVQMIAGVLLGIAVGTAVREVAGSPAGGSGGIAIAVAALIALAGALVLGGGILADGVFFVNQAQGAAILMIAVGGAATLSERVSDALIGGGVALVITVIVFPAAPLPLIDAAARRVSAALRDTLTRLTECADAGLRPDQEWILATGQRVHSELAGLEEARKAARQVASFSPRRWPERARVRRAGEEARALGVLAASVLSLAHACVGPGAERPHPPATRQALGELASALAALADGDGASRGDAGVSRAAAHALRARALATGPARTDDEQGQLIARLIETCADDMLRLRDLGAMRRLAPDQQVPEEPGRGVQETGGGER